MDIDYDLIEMYQEQYDMSDRYETEELTCRPHVEPAKNEELIW